jgi:hypothetical protein
MAVRQEVIISYKKIVFLFLLLSIIVYPINYSIGGLRLLDVSFLLMFIFSLKYIKVRKINLLYILPFVIVFTISILIGSILSDNVINLTRIIFIYKYSFPFLLVMILYNLNLNNLQLKKLLNYTFFSYIFLVLWVYVYLYLVANGNIHGSSRPSYPLSNDYRVSGAHLYSSTLSVGLVFFVLFYKYTNYSKALLLLFLPVSLGAVLLTGSKSGLVVIIFSILFHSLLNIKKILSWTPSFFISLMLVMAIFYIGMPKSHMYLLERATTFNLNDESYLSRITKMFTGIKDAENTFFLVGTGILTSSLTWYDSLIGILMSHSGALGFLSFFFILYYFWRNTMLINVKKSEIKNIFTILFFGYILANFITEFFLLSRSLFPVIIYLFITYQYLKLEEGLVNKKEVS